MSSRDNEPHFDANLETPQASVYDRDPPPPSREKGRSRRQKVMAAMVAMVALGGFSGIAWYAMNKSQKDPGAVVPVITAESDPIKERPTDPGGLEIPNRGMEVFNQITPGKEPQKVERLLPPAETPVARPEPEAAPPAGPLVADAPQIQDRANAGAVAPATEPKAPPPPPAQEVAKAPVAPAAVPPKEANPAPAPAPKTVAALGGWQVQFGASKQESRANAALKRISDANKDLLGPLTTSVVKADLGAKGTFFRMRAGPLADRAAADALCQKLKARKVGCIVVKP